MPASFLPDTSLLRRWLAAYGQDATGPIDATYAAIATWHRNHDGNHIPDQPALCDLLDKAILELRTAEQAAYHGAARKPGSSPTAPDLADRHDGGIARPLNWQSFLDACTNLPNARPFERPVLLATIKSEAELFVAHSPPEGVATFLQNPDLDPEARALIEAVVQEKRMPWRGLPKATVPPASEAGPEQLSWRARAIAVRTDKPGMPIGDVARLVGIHIGTIYRAAATDDAFRQAIGIRAGKRKLARGASDSRSGNLDGEFPSGYSHIDASLDSESPAVLASRARPSATPKKK
jgi:hypothetical protein